jgi:hypothetical protein
MVQEKSYRPPEEQRQGFAFQMAVAAAQDEAIMISPKLMEFR